MANLRVSLVHPVWALAFLIAAGAAKVPAQEVGVIALPPADRTLREKQFSRIQSVRELADGGLLVSDPLEGSLYVVDFRSGEVRGIGSIGEGPREYRTPGHLYPLGGDSTLLLDGIGHRALLLVGDRIVETMGAAGRTVYQFNSGAEYPWGVDRFGRILGVEGFAYGEDVIPMSRVYADSVRIVLTRGGVLGAEAGALDTIAELEGQARTGLQHNRERGGGTLYNTSFLASEGQAWLFHDGWIAVAHPKPYRVDWRTPERRWIRGAPLPFARVKVSLREKCFALGPWLGDPGDCRRREKFYPWPKHLPPFRMAFQMRVTPGGVALRPAPQGMLLVRRTPSADSPDTLYDVVDREGALRGTIRLAANQFIVGSGRASLYVVQKDDMDLLTLTRHPWPAQLGGG